jgi:hypothetical protein
MGGSATTDYDQSSPRMGTSDIDRVRARKLRPLRKPTDEETNQRGNARSDDRGHYVFHHENVSILFSPRALCFTRSVTRDGGCS